MLGGRASTRPGERTRNSANPSRASLIFLVGAHSKSHFGLRNLTASPEPRVSTDRLKLSLCPEGTSLSPQFIGYPNAAAESAMRATYRDSSERSSSKNRIARPTVFMRSRTLSIATSPLSRQSPSSSEVITFVVSSKTSLLFFCQPPFITRNNKCPMMTTYLAESRSCHFPMSFPLVELSCYDVTTEQFQCLVVVRRFGEF